MSGVTVEAVEVKYDSFGPIKTDIGEYHIVCGSDGSVAICTEDGEDVDPSTYEGYMTRRAVLLNCILNHGDLFTEVFLHNIRQSLKEKS